MSHHEALAVGGLGTAAGIVLAIVWRQRRRNDTIYHLVAVAKEKILLVVDDLVDPQIVSVRIMIRRALIVVIAGRRRSLRQRKVIEGRERNRIETVHRNLITGKRTLRKRIDD